MNAATLLNYLKKNCVHAAKSKTRKDELVKMAVQRFGSSTGETGPTDLETGQDKQLDNLQTGRANLQTGQANQLVNMQAGQSLDCEE